MFLNCSKEMAIFAKLPMFLRFASKSTRKVPEKIQVQLLKDHPNLGRKGEIVRVRSSYMRNYLHMGNGACYITKDNGPRIPVVEKVRAEKKLQTIEEEIKQDIAQQDEKAKAMSLDELTSLFNSMRSQSNKKSKNATETQKQAFESSTEQIAYTASELRGSIPSRYTIVLNENVTLPINKHYLSSLVYDFSGIQVPTSSIKLSSGHEDSQYLDEINTPGDYNWIFEIPGERGTVKKSLSVQ